MCVHAKAPQSCLILCNPMNCSPPGSPVHGGFSRQEYWSGLPCLPPGDLPDPGIKPEFLMSPAWQMGSLPLVPPQSVQSLSRVWLFGTQWTAARQASLSITNSQSYSNSCLLSRWCHPPISSSVIPFSCLQSFPASGSFWMSQFFTSGGHSTGVSASTSVLPMNIQDWFPLRWTGWISLQSKGLSRVFSNTIVQKRQFFSAQFSWTLPDGQHRNQIDYILCSQRWRRYTQSAKTRSGADCGSDHKLLIAKFRFKLKKVGKTTRPFRYDLSQIPYDYSST